MMILLTSLNSFQSSSSFSGTSRYKGSNFGPPGIAMLSAFAVRNSGSWNRWRWFGSSRCDDTSGPDRRYRQDMTGVGRRHVR